MAIEIERKFLLKSKDYIHLARSSSIIEQGYITTDPARTVRVRKVVGKSALTIKGISSDDGLQRYEFETSISDTDADDLLALCDISNIIRKVRYVVQDTDNYGIDLYWEVDEFTDIDLILVEVEIPTTETTLIIPSWVGKEVTGDKQYYNSNLSKLVDSS